VANLALSIGGVDSILSAWARMRLLRSSGGKRAAIILNPVKFDDLSLLRRRVEAEVRAARWNPTLWLETTVDDPGHEPARRALQAGVDLVLVAGGDGTVRAVSSELTGTGTPMALLPAGTGNLLARNLGVPLDTDAALRLALHGHARAIDVVRCETDNPDDDGILTQRFVVMAGIGLDAQIMENTSDDLKRVIRSGAYALAAVQNAAPDPFTATVTLDDGEPIEQQVVMALLGNVGTITAGVPLFPQASPSDGKVDLMLANPDRVVDWARLGAQILTGRDQEGFTTMRASHLRITTDRPVPFEIDGDIAGTTRSLAVEIEPGALFVIAPGR
jgi:diacylglycerol kinase, catalytic region